MELERRGKGIHVALVERRRSPEVIEVQAREQLCARLRQRLEEHAEVYPLPLQLLVGFHNTLLRGGWGAVENLSSHTLGKVRLQFDLLMEGLPPNALSDLGQRIRMLQAGAVVREDRAARQGLIDKAQELEDMSAFSTATLVIEVDNDAEFLQLNRAWQDTAVPAAGAEDQASSRGG